MSLRNAFELIATEAKQEAIRLLLASLDGKIAVNTKGRVKVAATPSLYDLVTGNIAANGGVVTIDVTEISNLMLHCKPSGSVSGHNASFEGSLDSTNGTDGTWFSLQAVRTNVNTIESATGALSAAPSYGWELSVNALRWVRIRATAHTSGTMTWLIQPGSYATEPIPAIQTHAVTISGTPTVSGTVTANIGTIAPTLYADTTTPLAAAGTFTGTSRDAGATPAFQRFVARVFTDQPGQLYHEDSTDGTTWRRHDTFEKFLDTPVLARYNRVVFVNGANAQTVLRITSGYFRS